jgi:hypothetical protein
VRRATAAVLALATLMLSACGPPEPGTMKGCVVVDVSGSSRPLITRLYLPGFVKFVQRISDKGSGDVCFAFAGATTTGGAGARAHFGCANPKDRLRCPAEIRRNVEAAAGQLTAVADQIANAPGPNQFRGETQILEALHEVGQATSPGDEILVLSDAIQSSEETGNFNSGKTLRLTDADIERILGRMKRDRLLPNLRGRVLRIPYPLKNYVTEGSSGLVRSATMSAAHKERIHVFYERYAAATGATLRYGRGEDDA